MIVESINDIIRLSGDLTTNQWEAIRTAAGLLLKRHPRGVVVDCGGLKQVSLDGAQTFYDMMVHIESKRARIIVANVPAHVREILSEVPDVRSGLAIAATVEDARNSLDMIDEIGNGKKSEQHVTGHLLLCLTGSAADPHAISLACAIAERRHLAVTAFYPIIVPRALPTSSPLPEEEHEATESLKLATDLLGQRGIVVTPIVERCRSVAAGLEPALKGVMVCVISLVTEELTKREPQTMIEGLLEAVSSEMILVRAPKT